MKITEYRIKTQKPIKKTTVACVSDMHARKFDKVIESLKCISPDIILLAGDILEVSNEYMRKRNASALEFLRQASEIAPTYYCFGNHEIYYSHSDKLSNRIPNSQIQKENIGKINSYGIHLVNDKFERAELSDGTEIYIGGLVCGEDMDPSISKKVPDTDFLRIYDETDAFKILLCHYPQYYEPYLNTVNFDIIFSGHAHGGQWRIFGQGIYAPHQGLFPRLTSGIHDGRLIISRGAANNSRPIPRFFNPTEVLKVIISQ